MTEHEGAARGQSEAIADIAACPRCGRPDPMFGNVKPTNATEQCWRRLLKAGNSIYVDTLCVRPAASLCPTESQDRPPKASP